MHLTAKAEPMNACRFLSGLLLLSIPGVASAEWKIYAQESPGGPWEYKITKQDNQGRQATMRGCTGMRGNHASKGVNQATGEEYVVVCSQANNATSSPAVTPSPSAARPAASAQTGTGAREWRIFRQKRAGDPWEAVFKRPLVNPAANNAAACLDNYSLKSVNTRTGEEIISACGRAAKGTSSNAGSHAPRYTSPTDRLLDAAREIDKGGLLGRVLPKDE